MTDSLPTRLFLVRHGDVGGAGALHGVTDVPLTPLGVRQIGAVARRLAREPLVAVVSSDLVRARRSAEIVAEPHGLGVEPHPAFGEMDFGTWDGRTMADLWADHADDLHAWWADLANYRTPGGESLADVAARVRPALARLLDIHRGQDLCLVAHGGVNRVILLDALGMSLDQFHRIGQDLGRWNRIDHFDDGRTVVAALNVDSAPSGCCGDG